MKMSINLDFIYLRMYSLKALMESIWKLYRVRNKSVLKLKFSLFYDTVQIFIYIISHILCIFPSLCILFYIFRIS